MEELPDDVVASVLRGLGAFLGDTPAQELPAELRRYKGFRSQGLQRHRAALFQALEDEGLRARIVEWMDDAKVSLSKRDAQALRLASARPEGWMDGLRAATTGARKTARPTRSREEILEEGLARERRKVDDVREQLRRVKEEGGAVRRALEADRRELTRRLDESRHRASEAEAEIEKLRSGSESAATMFERDLRRARRDAERATAAQEELRAELKRERRRATELEALNRELRDRLASGTRKTSKTAEPRRRSDGARVPLRVPKGLLDDAPETLDAWLDEPGVTLLVDGYNVTKSEGGFGDLELIAQRDRLIQEVSRLARKRKTRATIVFDGSEVAPGVGSRKRDVVNVVYSRPDESGDDRLVTLLSTLPGDPVVVVTNDRELRDRATELGANVATAAQLLTLLRPRR